MAEGCEHLNFAAKVNVLRLTDGEEGEVVRYSSEIRVSCADCGLPFEFIGAGYGMSGARPMMSPDGQELRAPICPEGTGGETWKKNLLN